MSVYRQESLWYREEEIRRSYERVRKQVEGFGRELLGRIEALLRESGLEEVAELIEALRKRQEEVLRGLSYELYRQGVQTELRGSGRYGGWDSMLSFLRQIEANLIEESVEALRRESEEVQHFAIRLGRTSLSDPGEVEDLLRAVPSYAPRLRRSLQKRYQKLVLTPLRQRLSALSPKTAQKFEALFAEAEEASPERLKQIMGELERQIPRLEHQKQVIASLRQRLSALSPKTAQELAARFAEAEEASPERFKQIVGEVERQISRLERQKQMIASLRQRLSALSPKTAQGLAVRFAEAEEASPERFEKIVEEVEGQISRLEHQRQAIAALRQRLYALSPETAQELAARFAEAEKASPERYKEIVEEVKRQILRLERQKLVIASLRERLSAISPETAQELDALFTEAEEASPARFEEIVRELERQILRLERQKLVLTPLRQRLSALSPETAQKFEALFAEAEEASPARFEKIVEEIETQILRLERERYTSSLAPFARPAQSQDESLAYARRRGVHYYERLRSLDPALAQENNALYAELQTTTDPYRASLLHNQLEYLYLTTLRTIEGQEKLKQDLAAAYAAMPVPELKAHLEALLSAPSISEAEAQAFLHKLAHAQPPPPSPSPEAQKEIFSRLFQQLSAAGYQLLSEDDLEAFLQGELVEVRTPFGAEYAVRARLEKDKLNLQFVKYRDSQDSPSDYEKRRDKEIAHRWCADYEKVQKLLAAEGIYAQTAHIIQPDEKLYYFPSQSRKAVADARQKTPQQSQKRQRS